jgi:hypothetical protein
MCFWTWFDVYSIGNLIDRCSLVNNLDSVPRLYRQCGPVPVPVPVPVTTLQKAVAACSGKSAVMALARKQSSSECRNLKAGPRSFCFQESRMRFTLSLQQKRLWQRAKMAQRRKGKRSQIAEEDVNTRGDLPVKLTRRPWAHACGAADFFCCL